MNVRADLRPGERIVCPVCGEFITAESGKLVPAPSPGREAARAVMLTPEQERMIGMTTGTVEMKPLSLLVRVPGKIAYDPDLYVAQEEYLQALKNESASRGSSPDALGRAKEISSSARRKLELMGMSPAEIDKISVSTGADVSLYLPGASPTVWAYLSVFETEIGLVAPGAEVAIEAAAYPGAAFSGRIVSVDPVLDSASRTNRARARVDNPEQKLKPEMFVNAVIAVDFGTKLAIPASAVIDTGTRKIVYRAQGGGMLEAREVTVGRKVGDDYEILGGLQAGDRVVTSGNFLIDSESRLQSSREGSGHQHGQ